MIRVQREDFEPAVELDAISRSAGAAGAVCSFVGLVRDFDDVEIKALTLEHYPGMTERELARVEDDARARWPLLDVRVVHRVGRLLPGERIVLVVTASAHRAAAFDACRYIVDRLKTRAPFWKCEETPDGRRWVAQRPEDVEAGGG